MRQHTVVFDGTPSRPWDRMIFAPQSSARILPRVEPPPLIELKPETRVSDRIRIASVLRAGWFTAHEAAVAANIALTQARSALTNLAIAGELEVDKSQHKHRYHWKRR